MNQKPYCPKINLKASFFGGGLVLLFLFLAGCKSSSLAQLGSKEAEQDALTVTVEESWEREVPRPYRATATREMDLLHMDLEVQLDWKQQRVLGKARLRMTPYFYPQKIIALDAKDFELGRIALVKGTQQELLSYRYDEKTLLIYLPEEVTTQDTVELEISYVAYPERNSGEGSAAISDTKGLYFIDPLDTLPGKPTMVWTQGETEHNSKWFPTLDRPNERMTHALHLAVPDSMVSISNGLLVRQEKLGDGLRKDHWEMNLPHAPYLVAMAVGDFAKVTASHGDLPLGYYVEKGFEKGAAKVFASTPQMIDYFEKTLGVSFPWQKYDQVVVRDFVSGAMENTTASIFMEELLVDEREALDAEWDYIVAHELFHQWFGDLVTAESWANLPLNEAFANYSEYLWNAHRYGQDQAALKLVVEKEGYFSEAESKQEDLIRFDYADAEEMFDAHSYNKGGLVLHQLRRQLGDAAFFKGLNLYLTKHAFRAVEAHDLRLAMEEVSGQDLNWFFNQWFFGKGHPEVEVEVDYTVADKVLVRLRQVQNPEGSPVFQFPLELSWYEGTLRKSKTVFLNEREQEVVLENEKTITQLYVDEGQDLLAKVKLGWSEEQYVRQFKESQMGVARYQALDSLITWEAGGALQEVLPLALRDTFGSVRARALLKLQSDVSWKDSLPGLEEWVYALAENDPQTLVRAGALDVLTAWNPSAYQGAFLRMARDPSYLVAGAALAGLTMGEDPKVELAVLESFEGEKNFRMRIPLAEYYINQKVAGKSAWFEQGFSELRGEGLYYFLGYYSSYFGEVEQEGRAKAIENLLQAMDKEGKDFLRVGAFQGLLGFVEEVGVLEKIREVADREESEELQTYFNYYLEMLKEEN